MAKRRMGNADEDLGAGSIPRHWEGRVGEAPRDGGGQALRADRYVAEVLGLLSRSQLKARKALIRINGREAKPSTPLKGGEALALDWIEEASLDLVPEDLPLKIVHEDGRVIVVDKAQGMVTHPGHGNRRGTLANALLGRLALASTTGPARATSPARAGIVHRLDKDTSGLIIAAKDAEAQAFLAAQFKDRTTRKEYLAITRGIPRPGEGRIENHLGRDPRDRKRFAAVEGGKAAVTDYRTLRTWGNYALLSLRPKTGRTHQLRVHLAGLGCPILGDPIYGRPDPELPGASLMLHAFRLRIVLPRRHRGQALQGPPSRALPPPHGPPGGPLGPGGPGMDRALGTRALKKETARRSRGRYDPFSELALRRAPPQAGARSALSGSPRVPKARGVELSG